jgi:hypothetical protein
VSHTPQVPLIGYYAPLAQIAACGQPSEETEITPALNESAVTSSAKSPEFVEVPAAWFHPQWAPDEQRLERSMPQSLQDSLRSGDHML